MALFDTDTKAILRPVVKVGEVDEALRARAQAQIATASKLGWQDREDELYYAVGTRPMDGALERSRVEWEKRASFNDLASGLIQRVKREGRVDRVVNVPDLEMLADGRVQSRIKQNPAELERRGLEALLRHVDGASSGVSYLVDEVPPDLRAALFNYHAARDVRTVRGVEKPHAIKLRLRNGDGRYKVWGVVGKNYPTVDVDTLAQTLLDELPGGARGEIKYNGYKASMTAQWHTSDTTIGVGGFLRAGLRLTTADDGTDAFDISAVLEQARCINLSVVPQVKGTGHFAHRGEVSMLRDRVRAAIVAAKDSIAPFVKAWGEAEQISIESLADPNECFTRLVERGYVKVAGVKKEDLIERLVKAYQFDRGMSKTAVINAVTRAAHTNAWQSKWAQEEMEVQAGQLVYQRLNLAA